MLQEGLQFSWVICKDGDELLRVGLGQREKALWLSKVAQCSQASKGIPATQTVGQVSPGSLEPLGRLGLPDWAGSQYRGLSATGLSAPVCGA